MNGRIWFPGNPWPDGHRVDEFEWAGRLDDLGQLWFDLSLRTADYDEAGDPGPDDRPDWESPIVWNNYHRCRISSTFWGEATGVLAATPGRPFRIADPQPQRLAADPLPIEDLDADPAFHVYLLGHDSVAEHTITFTADADGSHRIDWTGRVALTYAGDETFRYEFRAEIHGARLTQVTASAGAEGQLSHLLDVPAEQAASLLATV
ncbi:hypothetical protein KOI35_22130 [Actinoplanes bogorensis]|uniref:Uncharacterized protein n=1 Tax=Paractinoplanes bogorensis TaxID=1610840 RepID=A0ABS5YS72_9ACTN|nr:hypothetical protein [Actinoplanes bogorensis]MBU2666203.1 hypothetical protein [Actinoplanes bogorensis]